MTESRLDAYGYNSRNELTNAVKNAALNEYAYQYDDIGNRLSSLDLGTNRTYEANNLNQYTSISNAVGETFSPTFDLDGNQTLVRTATGDLTVSYNAENRPVSWTCGTTNIVMLFDSMGRRVQYLEISGSATNANNTFTYDNYLCIARNRNQVDNTTEIDRFIWDPTEPIATRPLVFNYSTAAPAYYTHDGNKNVSELVDIEEGVCAHYEYDIFGALKYSIGISKLLNPWGFSSEYEDYLCGLTYYNYRHYNHYFGNWTTRDRVEMENPYIYCDNIIFSFDVLGLEGFLSGLGAEIKKCWRRYKCYLLKSYLDEGSRFSGVDRKIFDMWMHGGGENPLNADAFDPGQELRNQIINNIVASHLNDNKDANCGGNPSKNYHATQTAISPTFHLGRLPDIMSYTIRGYKKFAYDCELRTEKECSKDCSCERINVSGECKFTFEDDFEFQDSGSFFFGLVDEKTVKDCACEFNWGVGKVHSFASDKIMIKQVYPCPAENK